uniref:Uncharacterized protein n=1 Tax=Rhipicephalus microplus TaxID=6941 RepID=A0A6G5A2V5_RHIMP
MSPLIFLLTIFEPTEFSLLNPNLWLANYDDIGKKAEKDFYLNSPCLFRVLDGLAWPDVCQLLSRADCLRFGEIHKALACFGERLAQEQNTKHSLCLTHDFCAASCIAGKEDKSSHEDLWHLIRKMQCFLSSLETVKKDYEAQIPFLAGLKHFVIKWDHEGVDSTVCDKDSQVSAIESILKQGAMPLTSAFTIWIVCHESLLKKEWICDILNDHVNLLSHPELFHRLFQAALCSDADTFIKSLYSRYALQHH